MNTIDTISAAIESLKIATKNLQEIRQFIRENHMVNVPNEKDSDNPDNEFEIDGVLYLVGYDAEITKADFENPEYNIEIKSIWACPVVDVDGEYVPLDKIEKNIFDRLLDLCDKTYQQGGLEMDLDFHFLHPESGCAHDQVAHD